jgi:type I site-specific restriction endonuclease
MLIPRDDSQRIFLKILNKKQLTETDIISKFIMPAVKDAGWESKTQIRCKS